jgi:hypothetical protein
MEFDADVDEGPDPFELAMQASLAEANQNSEDELAKAIRISQENTPFESAGAATFESVDPGMDPDLLLALQMSREESASMDAIDDNASNLAAENDALAASGNFEDDLARALALSEVSQFQNQTKAALEASASGKSGAGASAERRAATATFDADAQTALALARTATPVTTAQEKQSNRQRDELVILYPVIHSLYHNQLPDSRQIYLLPKEEVIDHKAAAYHGELIEFMRVEHGVLVLPLHTTGT